MKKHKNKGLFLVVTFMFMAFSIFHVKDVFAAEIDYDARAKELCKSKLENRKVEWDESKKKLSSDQSQLTVYIKIEITIFYTFFYICFFSLRIHILIIIEFTFIHHTNRI